MKYSTRKPRLLGNWEDDPLLPSLSVSETQATETGLVNKDGFPIYRNPNPLGFGRDSEW